MVDVRSGNSSARLRSDTETSDSEIVSDTSDGPATCEVWSVTCLGLTEFWGT